MSWKSKLTSGLFSAASVLGGSVAYIKSKFGVAPTDAQVDKITARAHDVAARLEAVLVEYIDDIPGVPNVLATLAADAALKIVDAAIAGAGEAVKAKN